MNKTPPVAPIHRRQSERHGVSLVDDYDWLKVANWQEVMRRPELLDQEVRSHLEAENAYAEAVMAPVADFRRRLFDEMKARIKQDDSSVPAVDGAFAYFARYVTDGQQPLFCRQTQAGDGEVVLLDGNKEADGTSFFRIGACSHSTDHRRIAWSADHNGSEYYEIRIRDIDAGTDLPDRLINAQGDVVWANDGMHVFYTTLDDNHRPHRVLRHRVGEDALQDAVVYEEADPGFFVGLDKSESGKFIIVTAHDHTTSEVHLIDADDPDGPRRLVAEREKDIEYDVAHHGDQLIIRTNADGAEDFKIVTAPVEKPARDGWRDLVAHTAGCLIRQQLLFARHLVRLERRDGLPRIIIRRLSDSTEHEIAFDEEAYDLGLAPGYEFDTETLRFTYSSMTTPQRTYDYAMDSRTRELMKEQEIPSGHDPQDYVTRRVFAESHDGEKIPVSLLYRRGTALDGSAPLLLYGYGSYGHTIPAGFSPNRYSLVDRGAIYAIAHVRGGMAGGWRWYRDGRGRKKRNTFDDFIAAADHLVAGSFTGAGRIIAHGGSAGGMLVGAVVNMRPDLFGGILAEVPFVDVLNTMSDADLPLTPPEWPEWGNPITGAEDFAYIRGYCPYQNVTAQTYPAILATAGLTDPRVTYWEPAKWVARLRATKTGDNPVLLWTNMTAGHAGAAGRFDKIEEVARVYAFALYLWGLNDT